MAARATSSAGTAVQLCGVRVTSPDRVVYRIGAVSLTKLDVAKLVERLAPLMLPHVRGRPISVVRCRDGSEGPGFFQKHVMKGMPAQIHSIDVAERRGVMPNLTVHDAAGLVGLVQMSALEFHVWPSKPDDPDAPDRLIIDLDPGDALPWLRLVEAAREVRQRLAADGLQSFVKTTGGKGLHVIAPIDAASWHDVSGYAERLANAMASAAPDRFTVDMKKALRAGRIYIDWLRNTRGATVVAPWSPRKSGAVSVPVAWEELADLRSVADVGSARWTVATVDERARSHGDAPWRTFAQLRQRLP